MSSIPVLSHWISGAAVPAEDDRVVDDINPAMGAAMALMPLASPALVGRAVDAARAAFPAWRDTPAAERGAVLQRAADLLRARRAELAVMEAEDTGKPITETRAVDVDTAADALAYFAGLARTIHGQHFDLGGRAFAMTRREPLGVCGQIGAWNYPLQIACWKSAPALATGNTVVFKPSEMTPRTARVLAEVFQEAGLPDGVFNVVFGAGETGKALVEHPDVDKVSLTGSVPTGIRVAQGAAATLKHVTLELGGKSPLIVFADANMDDAVAASLLANFYSNGEICSNGTRVFVQRPVYEAFLERVASRATSLVIGDPLAEDTHVGALISAAHLDRVETYVEGAKAEGARLVCGGARETVPGLESGAFFQPTVFADVTDDMVIAREEVFGPVMSVLPFDEEDEVLARANGTPFGLAAGVFTADLTRAHRMAAALETGICWINTYNLTPPEVPFGGVKHSGLGRENSLAALDHYTQLKTVYVELGGVDDPYPQ